MIASYFSYFSQLIQNCLQRIAVPALNRLMIRAQQ